MLLASRMPHYMVVCEGGLKDDGDEGGVGYGGWVEGERHVGLIVKVGQAMTKPALSSTDNHRNTSPRQQVMSNIGRFTLSPIDLCHDIEGLKWEMVRATNMEKRIEQMSAQDRHPCRRRRSSPAATAALRMACIIKAHQATSCQCCYHNPPSFFGGPATLGLQ